jgi:hypothetical protein
MVVSGQSAGKRRETGESFPVKLSLEYYPGITLQDEMSSFPSAIFENDLQVDR